MVLKKCFKIEYYRYSYYGYVTFIYFSLKKLSKLQASLYAYVSRECTVKSSVELLVRVEHKFGSNLEEFYYGDQLL